MAKKKIFQFIPSVYYVYYDNKTGAIFSVSNEKTDRYEYGLEVPYDDVEKLLTGEWNFSDYIVGIKKAPDGNNIKCIMPSIDQDYAFRHNVFEWISPGNADADFIVEWDFPNKTWNFLINPVAKAKYEKELLLSRVVFFVTLENDFNFLIRSIFIDIKDLLENNRVSIQFNSTKELDINQISISSKLVFNSYNLRVIYD